MNVLHRPKIVLLGMLSRHPVAGMVWLTMQYLVGFQRLGYDVYYVEAHGCTPRMFMRDDDDGSVRAANFIAQIMTRFDFDNHWAFHAMHSDGACYGISKNQLYDLYGSAALLINLHGGTTPLPEHSATGRLIYLGTDPVKLEVELHDKVPSTVSFLSAHSAFFTWGENHGSPDCKVPVAAEFQFRPTRQPVVLDFWKPHGRGVGRQFTTIANWRQLRTVRFQGEVYHWSKHYEFLKFLELPLRTRQTFELALTGYNEADQRRLEEHGWSVRDAYTVSEDPEIYRQYIRRSRGEFTVAKDQNVRLRSGWFSDRSATYLAAGRPVITQETGFSNILPTGRALFAFSTLEDIVTAVERVNADYERESRAALEIAREYFSYEVVLSRMLADVGL